MKYWPKKLTFKYLKESMIQQYKQLLESEGGAHQVALAFAIGFGLEMLVLSTVGVVYIFFYFIAKIFKTPLSVMVIGNVIGKLTTLPVLLLPLAVKIGDLLSTHKPERVPYGVYVYLKELLGMTVLAVVLGILSYIAVYILYEVNRKKRQ